jgi:hypothetical protein
MCLVGAILLWYRAGAKENWVAIFSSRPGLVMFLLIAGALGSAKLIVRRMWRPGRSDTRDFRPALIFNIVVVFSVLIVVEAGIRAIVIRLPTGEMIGSRHLLPRDWQETRQRFAEELEASYRQERYLIPDDLLGWTIGPSRRGDIFEGETLKYFSSREGLRSPALGMTYDRDLGGCRIAIVGDSFVHGDDVSFEDTWGTQLERLFGGRCTVLNFGVSGFGVDQIFLRYQRDVRPWHPTAVVFGFISDDLNRMMNTYGFLHLRRMRLPAPKPRFIIADDNRLQLLNMPLPTNETIVNAVTISDLPFVDYDWDYAASEWTHNLLDVLYVFRWYKTAYPLPDRKHPSLTYESMESIATAIFKAFSEQATLEGSYPLVVWFPSAYANFDEIDESEPGWSEISVPSWEPLAPQFLRKANVPWSSPLACLKEVHPEVRLTKGSHYTRVGNAAVAQCIYKALQPQISKKY